MSHRRLGRVVGVAPCTSTRPEPARNIMELIMSKISLDSLDPRRLPWLDAKMKRRWDELTAGQQDREIWKALFYGDLAADPTEIRDLEVEDEDARRRWKDAKRRWNHLSKDEKSCEI